MYQAKPVVSRHPLHCGSSGARSVRSDLPSRLSQSRYLHPQMINNVSKKKQRTASFVPDAYSASALRSSEEYGVPSLVVSDHTITAPLDYSKPNSGETIDVFFRMVVHRNKVDATLPYLLYLQGGPGFEAPRPLDANGWMKSASNYFRIILMDQRGTGLSSGISPAGLATRGTPEQQASYLKCFRADSIVRDAELIREALFSDRTDPSQKRWSILGQSFGGFCCTTYLSLFPQSLAEVLMTGGIPPGITMPCSAETVYKNTWNRVLRQNDKFYKRFPQAAGRAKAIVDFLLSQPLGYIETPMGNYLRPRTFQLLGLSCLGFAQGFERLNYMLESAFDAGTGTLSTRFLKDFDTIMSWDTNPLYALMHESIYCQGSSKDSASRWAAHRVRNAEFYSDFAPENPDRVNFTGEMVFPWMFEDFKELRKVKDVAELIANDTNWTALYDVNQLRANVVPVAAATYYEDMFVDFNLAQGTAEEIAGIQQHVTSEWLHDGIRENGGALFEKLLNMARGGILMR